MNDTKGFTLIELLIIVGLLIFLGIFTTPVLTRFILQTNHQNKTNEIISALRNAQTNSISGKGNSRWGVSITATAVTVYKGISFSERDIEFDQMYSIPSSINVTPIDVVFERNSGKPNAAATIVVSSNVEINTITVNAQGIVNVN